MTQNLTHVRNVLQNIRNKLAPIHNAVGAVIQKKNPPPPLARDHCAMAWRQTNNTPMGTLGGGE